MRGHADALGQPLHALGSSCCMPQTPCLTATLPGTIPSKPPHEDRHQQLNSPINHPAAAVNALSTRNLSQYGRAPNWGHLPPLSALAWRCGSWYPCQRASQCRRGRCCPSSFRPSPVGVVARQCCCACACPTLHVCCHCAGGLHRQSLPQARQPDERNHDSVDVTE